jgi:hypothetical protein
VSNAASIEKEPCVGTNVAGRELSDPSLAAFWSKAEELAVLVAYTRTDLAKLIA